MIDAPLMTESPPATCWFCGEPAGLNQRGLCESCHRASRRRLVICANCTRLAGHRGRGLCGRCYQRLARTGTLPAPNLTTPAEVLA